MIQNLIEKITEYKILNNREPKELEISVGDYEVLIGEISDTYSTSTYVHAINRYFNGVRLKII